MSDDPRTYDYLHPTRSCDVVLKGGITSGVVYPHGLCELARTYRFSNVGGTSAGAIAAAGAAAAEHGRERGGFEKLAELPEWIGGDDNLFRLFQPQPRTPTVLPSSCCVARPEGRRQDGCASQPPPLEAFL